MHPVSHYELLQLPIVSLETAEVVGEVNGLVLDMTGLRLAAFVTRMGFYEASVLPIEAAHAVGRDAVMVPGESVLRRVGQDRRLESLIEADVSLSGATALTTEGQAVGVVGAYYLDRESGRLAGVQLIPPVEIDTAPEGLLPFSAVHRMGDSLLIIDAGYHSMLVQDEEGLSAAMAAPTEPQPEASATPAEAPASDDTGDAAAVPPPAAAASRSETAAGEGETGRPKERRPRRSRSRRQPEPAPEPAAAEDGAAETESSAAERPDSSFSGETPAVSDQTDPVDVEPTEPTERYFLIGKRVLRRIEAPDGTLIADAGDTVNPEMVRRARAGDQLLILGLNVE